MDNSCTYRHRTDEVWAYRCLEDFSQEFHTVNEFNFEHHKMWQNCIFLKNRFIHKLLAYLKDTRNSQWKTVNKRQPLIFIWLYLVCIMTQNYVFAVFISIKYWISLRLVDWYHLNITNIFSYSPTVSCLNRTKHIKMIWNSKCWVFQQHRSLRLLKHWYVLKTLKYQPCAVTMTVITELSSTGH